VLSLNLGREEGDLKINWEKFFDISHPYKLLYILQIVQAVVDNGNTDQKRATTLNFK
jgi:hypothetical protein